MNLKKSLTDYIYIIKVGFSKKTISKKEKKIMKKTLSMLLAVMMLVASFGMTSTTAFAASKKPAATSITSVKAQEKAFTVKWKKKSGVTGYQIQYSTNSGFKKGNKTVKIKKAKTVSKKITGLKASKKYYVRVRTYKASKKKTTYSKWSSKKSVTTQNASNSYTVDESTIDASKISVSTVKCADGDLVVYMTNNNSIAASVKVQIVFTDVATGAILDSETAESYCIGAGKTAADSVTPSDSNYYKITNYNYYISTTQASKSYYTDLTGYVGCQVQAPTVGQTMITFTNNGATIDTVSYVAVAYDANGNALTSDWGYPSISQSGMVDVNKFYTYDSEFHNITPAYVEVTLNHAYSYNW